MSAMNFSTQKQYVRPPARGIFPLDHDSSCRVTMQVRTSTIPVGAWTISDLRCRIRGWLHFQTCCLISPLRRYRHTWNVSKRQRTSTTNAKNCLATTSNVAWTTSWCPVKTLTTYVTYSYVSFDLSSVVSDSVVVCRSGSGLSLTHALFSSAMPKTKKFSVPRITTRGR